MKLHVVSDLHLGHADMTSLPDLGDILILAGDIVDSLDSHAIEQFKGVVHEYISSKKMVVWIPGNHEYYHQSFHQANEKMKTIAKELGVHLLIDDILDLPGNVRLFGATLWTDLKLGGLDLGSASWTAKRRIADYQFIRIHDRILNPSDTLEMHNNTLIKMKHAFQSFEGKRVILSHHLPHPKSVHDMYRGDPINVAFASDLTDVIRYTKPDLWIHGHTHHNFDYFIVCQGFPTHIVCNPRGYLTRNGDFENPHFREDFVVEL